MTKKQLLDLLAKVRQLYIEKSFHEQINDPNYLFDGIYYLFKQPLLPNLQNFLNDKANTNKFVKFMMASSVAELLPIDIDKNYCVFILGTLLSRADFIYRAMLEKNWETALAEAKLWIEQHRNKLINYWHIHSVFLQQHRLQEKVKDFLTCLPLCHEMQFKRLELFSDEYDKRWVDFFKILPREAYTKDHSRKLADLAVYLQSGPQMEHGLKSITWWLNNILEKKCHLIFALGNSVIIDDERFFFPFQFVEKAALENDFYDYFAEKSDPTKTEIYNRRCEAFKVPPIVHDSEDNVRYQVGDEFVVNVKRLIAYDQPKDPSAVISHDLHSYVMQITRVGDAENPHTVIVHNVKVPDNNPLKLTEAQLNLVMNSLVKAHCEDCAAIIHCRGGRGRTGLLGYLTARMFCPEMPASLAEALKWLRKWRPGVINTVEQFIDAEDMWLRVQEKLKPYMQGEGIYDWERYYKENNLDKHLGGVFATQSNSATHSVAKVQEVLANGNCHYHPPFKGVESLGKKSHAERELDEISLSAQNKKFRKVDNESADAVVALVMLSEQQPSTIKLNGL